MNRIANRAWAIILLAVLLVGGVAAFLVEFAIEGGDWAVYPGSPHVYSYGRVTSSVTDRNGEMLLDMSGERTYAEDADVRKAVLHWTGDRDGYISTPFYDYYAKELSGYDVLNGVYHFGENAAQMALTLDAELQEAALEAMDGRHGTIAVYNYKTGELLCAISTPTFDPDDAPNVADDEDGEYNGVYLNRFLQSSYTPGSIFKIITTAAALDCIPDIEEQTFYCDQVYELGGGEVTCEHWHGEQTLSDAFANSCNIAFAKIVEQIGAERLAEYVEQFLLTQPVSFDGLTTESGNFDIENAGILDVAWSGIGQYTDLVNPCRFLTFMGTVANGGVEVQPHVVSKITVGGKTTYQAKKTTAERIMSASLAEALQEYMAKNVEKEYGTGHFPGLTVCAKSGTAQRGEGEAPNAMFAGFVQDEAYPLAFFVAVEGGGYGTDVCVPIVSQVLSACKVAMDGV